MPTSKYSRSMRLDTLQKSYILSNVYTTLYRCSLRIVIMITSLHVLPCICPVLLTSTLQQHKILPIYMYLPLLYCSDQYHFHIHEKYKEYILMKHNFCWYLCFYIVALYLQYTHCKSVFTEHVWRRSDDKVSQYECLNFDRNFL